MKTFAQNISVESQTGYLLDKALEKQRQIHAEFLRRGSGIHPLIIVQIPNRAGYTGGRGGAVFRGKKA